MDIKSPSGNFYTRSFTLKVTNHKGQTQFIEENGKTKVFITNTRKK